MIKSPSFGLVFALTILFAMGCVINAVSAEPVASENGLPQATTSEDGQFVFVPLTTGSHVRHVERQRKEGRPRVVLALGGGGMRGAAHVGVLKALVAAGIPIDGIAGTSMGSIVGGMYSAGIPLNDIEKHFVDGSLMKAFVPIPVPLRVAMIPVISAPRLIGFHPYDGVYFERPFHKYLDKVLPEDKKVIEKLNIPFCAVAIDLCDGHAYAIKKGSLLSAMQASSAVPALRKPVEISGRLFVDGGVLANVPVPHARQLGADVTIAVQIDERFDKEPPEVFRKAGSVTRRMVKLQLAALDSFYERDADVIIHPNVDGISLMSTKVSDAKRAIAAGEEAAHAALPAIKQQLEKVGIATREQAQ